MVDDKITYDDFIKCVEMLLAADPPAPPMMIIWPGPDECSIFPDMVWMRDDPQMWLVVGEK